MSKVPKVVFIVPYRNRPQHKFFFSNYIKTIMDVSLLKDDYEVYFSHQCDTRAFNRGATKNIGFLAVKSKYPNDYKNITFVFNDIDTVPFSNIFEYETVSGIVRHFYGFEYALGGIVAITGSDFETINGYPNFWGWGMEDHVLQTRCERKNIQIDRSQFLPIGNPNVLHLFDGVQRIINRKEPLKAKRDDGLDGLITIHNLSFSVDKESSNPLDNIHAIETEQLFVINISEFRTGTVHDNNNYFKYDLREPSKKIMNPSVNDKVTSSDHMNANWSHIPFYPTAEKKNEMIKKYGQKEAEKIIAYSYQNSKDPTRELLPPNPPNTPTYNRVINVRPTTNVHHTINKFSPEYANLIGVKPKAVPSANIRLGGVYR